MRLEVSPAETTLIAPTLLGAVKGFLLAHSLIHKILVVRVTLIWEDRMAYFIWLSLLQKAIFGLRAWWCLFYVIWGFLLQSQTLYCSILWIFFVLFWWECSPVSSRTLSKCLEWLNLWWFVKDHAHMKQGLSQCLRWFPSLSGHSATTPRCAFN